MSVADPARPCNFQNLLVERFPPPVFTDKRLSVSAKLLWVALVVVEGEDPHMSSSSSLCSLCGITPPTLSRARASLIRHGYLAAERRGQRVVRYTVMEGKAVE